MTFNTSKESLMSGEGTMIILDESFEISDLTSLADEEYNLMIVFEESIVTFECSWLKSTGEEGTWITFTNKTLQPSNYPRKIRNVTLISGMIILEK